MFVFIVNPNAGGERGYRRWKILERHLDKWKIEYKVYITDCVGDAKKISSDITRNNDSTEITLVAVGGDGTVNEVLDGMFICDKHRLGYIPTGTGNDLARALKLPKSRLRCLKNIIYSRNIRHIDYGVLTYGKNEIINRRFIVSAGIGFDAAVCDAVSHSKAKELLSKFGLQKIAYIISGLSQLIKAKSVKGYVIIDGVKKIEFNHIFFISAHIHPFEGGGFRFAPKAKDDDGTLSICLIHNSSKNKLFKILCSAYMGKHLKYSGVRSYECKELKIYIETPRVVHADGENCFMQNEIELHCIERKLKFIL